MGRRVGKIGPMPLTRVDHQHADAAGSIQHLAARLNRRLQAGDVITQRFTETAGLEEIALHIDYHQRRPIEIDGKRRGFSVEIHFRHIRPSYIPMAKLSP
jgi:hypothetical protein